MSSVELFRNPRFEEWNAGIPSSWSQVSTTATTLRQLSRLHPLEHPQRRTFESFGSLKPSEKDYIFGGGPFGLRLDIAAAAVANSWAMRQEAATTRGIESSAGQRFAPRITSRCSVENNLLRCQIIGILGTTDTLWLTPDAEALDDDGNYLIGRGGFTWETSETNISWKMKGLWQSVGLQALFPLGVDSISGRLSNGSAGAQIIDIGEFSLEEVSKDRVGGAR